MTIQVQAADGGIFEVVTGYHRLKAAIEAFGHATVTNMQTGKEMKVHEVDGRIVEMTEQSKGTGTRETLSVSPGDIEKAGESPNPRKGNAI